MQAGVRQRVQVNRHGGRTAPVEISDGLELWARQHGGHASLKWLDAPMNCWVVRLSLKVGDPRLQSDKPYEQVYLHEYRDAEWWAKHAPEKARRHQRSNRIMGGSYAFDLDELGLEGVIQILDRGNLLSGRGEFRSAEEAGRKQVEKFRSAKHKRRLSLREDARHDALDKRRSILKIPFLPIGIEFDTNGTAKR